MGCEREKMLFSKQGLLIFKGQEHKRAFYAQRCGSIVLRVLCWTEKAKYICTGTTVFKPAE